jgi:hypothetical protein
MQELFGQRDSYHEERLNALSLDAGGRLGFADEGTEASGSIPD